MPRVLLVYHFFHPDDVVSARHYADLASDLARRGLAVTVLTSTRSCRKAGRVFPARERWNGIDIVRVHRPPWDQARRWQRLWNSAWLVLAWFLRALSLGPFDVVVVGSDPAFAPLLLIPLRLRYPRARFYHWCFDLYPEAITADGPARTVRLLAPVAQALMAAAYARCEALVDLGPCMRERLSAYGSGAAHHTITPWALVEPSEPGATPAAAPEPDVRARAYPGARLALLYSGTLGRAHDFAPFLALARRCRARSGSAIAFAFSCRGNRLADLRAALTPADTNVRLLPFADEAHLQAHLEAADIHLMSLRPEWSGLVVPSKFFGSLAVGKPVLYAGPATSAIARWVRELDVGLVLDGATLDSTVDRLHALAADRGPLAIWQTNARRAYAARFSRRVAADAWHRLLRGGG